MKMLLLIAGKGLYPKKGTGDWIATYHTYDEALSNIRDLNEGVEAYCFDRYEIGKNKYDWYSIVDLNKWCN